MNPASRRKLFRKMRISYPGAFALRTKARAFPKFDPSAAASNFIGSLGRNAFRGPGYFNTDLSLRKNFKLNERLNLQIGANAYNVLNHPNFANPVANTANSTQFGTIISTVTPATTPYGAFAAAAVDARIVQVTGKITF